MGIGHGQGDGRGSGHVEEEASGGCDSRYSLEAKSGTATSATTSIVFACTSSPSCSRVIRDLGTRDASGSTTPQTGRWQVRDGEAKAVRHR